jgi:PncC family amidohydrolase
MKFYLDNTEDIFLYQLLKAAGAIEEYAHIRRVIQEGEIKVNNQTVFKQRTRVFPGDEVLYKEMHIKILAGKSPAERPPKPPERREERVQHGGIPKWQKKPLKKEKSLHSELALEVKKLHNQLLRKEMCLSVAESCTGGLAGSFLSSLPGSSGYFLGGVISYSNQTKIKYLSVSKKTLDNQGAVSGAAAEEMAAGIMNGTGSDLSGSITGIAGPDGGEPGKPVGTVYIAVRRGTEKTVSRYQFSGTREEIRHKSCLELFRMLLEISAGTETRHDE